MKRTWDDAHGRNALTRRQKRRRAGYNLAVSELPEHVFVKKKLSLTISVIDAGRQCITDVDKVYISAELLNEDGTIADQSLIKVDQTSIVTKHGRALCDLTMMGLSAEHGNRKFKIRFHTEGRLRDVAILPAESKPFMVVARRIDIIHQPPTVWYKDEGGKQAAIEVRYRLVDGDGEVITSTGGRRPKIEPRLLFDSGEDVTGRKKTDGKPIFRVLQHSDVKSSKGIRMLRYRVDDVSRSHGLQNFKVELRPSSTDPNSYDMRSAYSDGTEVKSKRKTKAARGGTRSAGPAGLVTQAAILQHMDNTLTRLLKPLTDRIAGIERHVGTISQKIERVEHHLGIAPQDTRVTARPPPVSLTAPGITASGPQRPSQVMPSPNTIGALPPPVNYGAGLGRGLPAFQRNVSGHSDKKFRVKDEPTDAGQLPPLNIPLNMIPGGPGVLPPLNPSDPGFLTSPIVQDLTKDLPPLTGIAKQKSAAGYPAFDDAGHLRGFFQTTSLSSSSRGAKGLSFLLPQDSGLDASAQQQLEEQWRTSGTLDGLMVAGDDTLLLKTKLIRKISGGHGDDTVKREHKKGRRSGMGPDCKENARAPRPEAPSRGRPPGDAKNTMFEQRPGILHPLMSFEFPGGGEPLDT